MQHKLYRSLKSLVDDFERFCLQFDKEMTRLQQPRYGLINILSEIKPLKQKHVGAMSQTLRDLTHDFTKNYTSLASLKKDSINRRKVALALSNMINDVYEIRETLKAYLKEAENTLSDKRLINFLRAQLNAINGFIKNNIDVLFNCLDKTSPFDYWAVCVKDFIEEIDTDQKARRNALAGAVEGVRTHPGRQDEKLDSVKIVNLILKEYAHIKKHWFFKSNLAESLVWILDKGPPVAILQEKLIALKAIVVNHAFWRARLNPKGVKRFEAILASKEPDNIKFQKIIDEAIRIKNRNPYRERSIFKCSRDKITQALYNALASGDLDEITQAVKDVSVSQHHEVRIPLPRSKA